MSVTPVPAPRVSLGGANQLGLMSPPSQGHVQQFQLRDTEPRYANLPHGHQQVVNPLPIGAQRREEHTYDVPDFGNDGATTTAVAMVARNPTYSTSTTTAPSGIATNPNPAYVMTSSPAEQQLQQEIHFLRLTVNDKDAQLGKMKRDLDFSHDHIKQLNVLLAEKKEEVLKYQERISDMQTDMATLRDQAGRIQAIPAGPSQAEQSLQTQVVQLNRQIIDLRQQVTDLSRQNHQLRQSTAVSRPLRANSEGHEALALRQQVEQLRTEKTTTQQEMDMLRHQVTTYLEDFSSERKDRERAMEKIQTLREENDSLKQAITMLAREHNIRLDAYGLGGGAFDGQNQF